MFGTAIFCFNRKSHAQIMHLSANQDYPDYAILQAFRIPVNVFKRFSKLTYEGAGFLQFKI